MHSRKHKTNSSNYTPRQFVDAVRSVQECCKNIIVTSSHLRRLYSILQHQNQMLVEADMRLNELINKIEDTPVAKAMQQKNHSEEIKWEDFRKLFDK